MKLSESKHFMETLELMGINIKKIGNPKKKEKGLVLYGEEIGYYSNDLNDEWVVVFFGFPSMYSHTIERSKLKKASYKHVGKFIERINGYLELTGEL